MTLEIPHNLSISSIMKSYYRLRINNPSATVSDFISTNPDKKLVYINSNDSHALFKNCLHGGVDYQLINVVTTEILYTFDTLKNVSIEFDQNYCIISFKDKNDIIVLTKDRTYMLQLDIQFDQIIFDLKSQHLLLLVNELEVSDIDSYPIPNNCLLAIDLTNIGESFELVTNIIKMRDLGSCAIPYFVPQYLIKNENESTFYICCGDTLHCVEIKNEDNIYTFVILTDVASFCPAIGDVGVEFGGKIYIYNIPIYEDDGLYNVVSAYDIVNQTDITEEGVTIRFI